MITKPTTWQHGSTTGYKAHSCRCKPCRSAMSIYHQQHYAKTRLMKRPAPDMAPRSWWTEIPADGFTAHARTVELVRMRASKFGAGIGKLIDSNELNR